MVARVVWDHEAAGSSPVTSTIGMRRRFIEICGASVIRYTLRAIPHNSKCRYGERGAAAAKPKAQIILCAAKVSAASGGCSEPKQGQRSQSARGFCPRSTMRVPQPDIIEHFGNADAVPQPPERCLSRKAGIMRCCLRNVLRLSLPKGAAAVHFSVVFSLQKGYNNLKFCIA